MAYILYDNIRR